MSLAFTVICLLFVVLPPAVRLGAATPAPAWKAGEGYRVLPLPPSGTGDSGFELLPASVTGIGCTNRLSDANVAKNRLLEIGSGVALGDVDGDGRVDIYVCRLEGGNVLYRNMGDWHFEDVTSAAGVECRDQFSTGCVLVDLDGDGDLDLLVNSLGGGTRAFFNDGTGRFLERSDLGLQRMFGATSMGLADVDGDGDLDLYVCNYRTDTFFDHPPGLVLSQRQHPDGSTVVEPALRFLTLTNGGGGIEVIEKGEPDFFYINRGQGKFVVARWDGGLFRDEDDRPLSSPPTDWGLSVLFRDLNGDGLPDLYVCNDFVHWTDRIWINQGGKRFRAAPRTSLRSVSLSSMAVDVADVNRDGFDDIFVADMISPSRSSRAWQRPDTLGGVVRWPVEDPLFRTEVARNTLQLSRGDGTYAEISRFAGVFASDWTWGAAFVDVDLDGWEDLLLSTGSAHDVQDADVLSEIERSGGWKTPEARLKAFARLPHRATPSVALRNRHDSTFEDAGWSWGFDAVGYGQGMALGDLDNDGDLDVVVNCLNGPPRVYRNRASAPRVAVRLKGGAQNTRGIGARIKVLGGPVSQTQEMVSGGRYLSGDDAMRVFAAGTARELRIEVVWRNGSRSVVPAAKPNHLYEIEEPGARGISAVPPPATPTLFQDVTEMLNDLHVDRPFDDFAAHPLLPRKLSTMGPQVAWCDLNGDGLEDLVMGGGTGTDVRAYLGSGTNGWSPWSLPDGMRTNSADSGALVCWRRAGTGVRMIVGCSNWRDPAAKTPSLRVYSGKSLETLAPLTPPELPSMVVGPVAMADVDGDGTATVFIGGRTIAGRYPEAADSYLVKETERGFEIRQRFPALGRVTGAVFVDLDGDGDVDLAVTSEWDCVHVLRNDGGHFSDRSAEWGLAGQKGWWNGIAAGDFDGDGRMDLVVSNWGRNWRMDQRGGAVAPVQLYYGDFAGDGGLQTLVASLDPSLGKITPWAEWRGVVAALPFIGAGWPTHHSYSQAGVQELLGDLFPKARMLEASAFDSVVLLNRGDHFEGRPLPMEAQLAPAFGLTSADFDGDGNEDLFLAQNFFGVDPETSRDDAGTGLVLLGDGRGGFRALSPRESGVSIYGEQRGCAIADYDGDGRVDLVVAQHNGPTRLFRGRSGIAGVRVTLRESAKHPLVAGGSFRLRYGDRLSRTISVHAGGGMGSQDSFTRVVAGGAEPTAVEVRWPNREIQKLPFPPHAASVEISDSGIIAK